MNSKIEAFARETLKSQLAGLTPENHRLFKLMYSPGKPDLPIKTVVDEMPAEKLDWAMQKVQRTVDGRASPKN